MNYGKKSPQLWAAIENEIRLSSLPPRILFQMLFVKLKGQF